MKCSVHLRLAIMRMAFMSDDSVSWRIWGKHADFQAESCGTSGSVLD